MGMSHIPLQKQHLFRVEVTDAIRRHSTMVDLAFACAN